MLHPLIEIHYIAPVKLNKFLLPDFEIQPFPVTADCLLYTLKPLYNLASEKKVDSFKETNSVNIFCQAVGVFKKLRQEDFGLFDLPLRPWWTILPKIYLVKSIFPDTSPTRPSVCPCSF